MKKKIKKTAKKMGPTLGGKFSTKNHTTRKLRVAKYPATSNGIWGDIGIRRLFICITVYHGQPRNKAVKDH